MTPGSSQKRCNKTRRRQVRDRKALRPAREWIISVTRDGGATLSAGSRGRNRHRDRRRGDYLDLGLGCAHPLCGTPIRIPRDRNAVLALECRAHAARRCTWCRGYRDGLRCFVEGEPGPGWSRPNRAGRGGTDHHALRSMVHRRSNGMASHQHAWRVLLIDSPTQKPALPGWICHWYRSHIGCVRRIRAGVGIPSSIQGFCGGE